MIRAVLHSSVLVSAFLKPDGTSATLLAHARKGAFLLCLSPAIVAETAAVLLRPHHQRRFRFAPEEVIRFGELLGHVAERVEGELPVIRAVPDDPKDDVIVASAVAAGNLVTGDRRHLLPLGSYAGVRIVSVGEFLAVLEAEP